MLNDLSIELGLWVQVASVQGIFLSFPSRVTLGNWINQTSMFLSVKMGAILPIPHRIIGGYTELFYIKCFEYCLALMISQINIFIVILYTTSNISSLIIPFLSSLFIFPLQWLLPFSLISPKKNKCSLNYASNLIYQSIFLLPFLPHFIKVSFHPNAVCPETSVILPLVHHWNSFH